MNEMENKLDKMIRLLDKDFEIEFISIKKKYEDEYKNIEEKIKKEIDNYEKIKLKEAHEKQEQILKLAEAKAELKLKQENLILKNQLLSKILELLKSKLIDLDPERKKLFYQKLYREAVKLIDEDYIVLCNEKDYNIINSFIKDHKIEIDNTIKGGIILKGKYLNIKNTIDSFIEENKNWIFSLVLKEVGEI
ncbi:V/A-type H+-transporting ATPase subunit E [Marinitoga hydrogenitolerans DSM 16785]|uniref:V/A-type H+-transporting ATPase subunit E n=1 Tax=Marinitoga hydrogenitolerans (strain DSM 16785 / JCM 12826 / AT1271) TaxID=1122195 RepID=A0A1M4VAT1_MARH1|nr:V-type ATP synthase subunit E family protein [Marinitoga hydrogenitolerans]SHE66059.1 V/A-type H+-transporting ATPase subunit E [Marinitoga hydrogenitolerans DSM 16785]